MAFDESKLEAVVGALFDLLDEKSKEYGLKEVSPIDVSDPLAKGIEPVALVRTMFYMADRHGFDEQTFGFAIALLQSDFANITGTVPISDEVCQFVAENAKNKEE